MVGRIVEEGIPRILRKYRDEFGLDSEGFLFPMKIYINYCFEINSHLAFSGLLVKKEM